MRWLRLKLWLVSTFLPWIAVRELEAENKLLVDSIAEPLLTGIRIGNGSIDIGIEHFGAKLLAGMFLGMFEKYPDAKNYIEITLGSPQGPVLVTICRPGGKTPHGMVEELKAEVARLEAGRQ